MQDDRLESPLDEAARAYHAPSELDAPERESMWHEIEAAHFEARRGRHGFRIPPWVGLAAAVVVGIALGRVTPLDRLLHPAPPAARSGAVVASASPDALPLPPLYEPTTSQYLDQTAALLVTLPTEVRAGRADQRFIGRAANLLLTTRLLLDSPAAQDAKLRGLLDDLEVVLVQVVRLQSEQNSTDLDLINQALEQRDVLPRLRTVAADLSAD
jgi:hypothetical protein